MSNYEIQGQNGLFQAKIKVFFIKIYEETIFIIKFFSKIKLIIKRN